MSEGTFSHVTAHIILGALFAPKSLNQGIPNRYPDNLFFFFLHNSLCYEYSFRNA